MIGENTRKMTVARDGRRRRVDFDVDQPQHRSVIDADGRYLIDFERKSFASLKSGDRYAGDDEFVIHALNQRHYTEFEDAGKENGLQIYRAEIDASPASEIIIYVDPATNLPMKQEFYSIDGERRDLTYSFELQNVKLDIDAGIFEVPKGFREVTAAELKRRPR